MVHLVLQAGGEQAIELGIMRGALLVEPGGTDPCRSVDIAIHLRHRQAAFVVNGDVVRFPGDHRVDEHPWVTDVSDFLRLFLAFGLGSIGVLGTLQVDDEDTFRHADLNRGKADTRGIIHRLEHVGDQRAMRIGDALHGAGNDTQPRVRSFDDIKNSHGGDVGRPAPRVKKPRLLPGGRRLIRLPPRPQRRYSTTRLARKASASVPSSR